MKQRIRVIAICKKADEVLLLKRAAGRLEGEVGFELPTGKIAFGEQPDEAMVRVIYENMSIHAERLQLLDVVTFINLVNSSKRANLYIVYAVTLAEQKISIEGERYRSYKWVKNTEIEVSELDEASLMVLSIVKSNRTVAGRPSLVVEVGAQNKDPEGKGFATIYTDGGSRGNPGPSGTGYYIVGADGEELKRGGEFIGFSSSRLAEYYGLKAGIEQALAMGLKKVHFRSDSLMLVNQMNGVYEVKNADLMSVHEDVLKLLERLERYSFTFVPRTKNWEADKEVNKAIDRASVLK